MDLASQIHSSIQESQRRNEVMQQLRAMREMMMGAASVGAGGAVALAGGAQMGLGMASPFMGGAASLIGQSMGMGGSVSASAFGPRVGGPGGLLYNAGLGDVLGNATRGLFFQDVNKSISQTSLQMQTRARNELTLRGREIGNDILHNTLTLGGVLDNSLAYRFTGGADVRIGTDITRKVAGRLEGLGVDESFATASRLSDRVMSGVGRLNRSMGYGLSAKQQEEMASLSLEFAGPVGTANGDAGDKSDRFLAMMEKNMGKLGVAADKLMDGFNILKQSGAANLTAANLYTETVAKARSSQLFGTFGSDEFVTKLSGQIASAASSQGIRGAQANTYRDAKLAQVAATTRMFEAYGLNQGVFGTGEAGLHTLAQTREQMMAQALGASGLYAATNKEALADFAAGKFSSPLGRLIGGAGSTVTALTIPILAAHNKVYPTMGASVVAAMGPAGFLENALGAPGPLTAAIYGRNMSGARAQLGLSGDIAGMTEEQQLELAQLHALGLNMKDTKQIELVSQLLVKSGALPSVIGGGGLPTVSKAFLNVFESPAGRLFSATQAVRPTLPRLNGRSAEDTTRDELMRLLSGLAPSELSKVAQNDQSAISSFSLGALGGWEGIYQLAIDSPELLRQNISRLSSDDPVRGIVEDILNMVSNTKANVNDSSNDRKFKTAQEMLVAKDGRAVSGPFSHVPMALLPGGGPATANSFKWTDKGRAWVLERLSGFSAQHTAQLADGLRNKQEVPGVRVVGVVTTKPAESRTLTP